MAGGVMRDAAAAASLLPSLATPPRIPARRRTPHHRHLPIHHHHHHHHQRRQQTLPPLVESTHHARHRLRAQPRGKLSARGRSTPLRLLPEQQDGGGRSSDGFCWPVVNFPKEEEEKAEEEEGAGRIGDARYYYMFDDLPRREPSPATGDADYWRTVRLVREEGGSAEEAASVLGEMAEPRGLPAYNSLVHGLAREGDFQGARDAIGRMGEVGLVPVAETYHGLIRAYGEARMYAEMSKLVRGMACEPNEVTYNMLIVEYARGGLLQRMEAAHTTLLSKRMHLLPSTLVVMLQTYADLGVLDKMDRAFRKSLLASKAYLKETLIRKLALVYIDNYRFARLEEFANEVASRTGRTFVVWCLLLLASALLSSRKGMESIAKEMTIAKVSPHITFTNIVAIAHMKMKDFRDLDSLLSQVGASGGVKPDLVTVGILFDACSSGFDGTRVLDVWRRNRFLEQAVEMNTDPLVIAAFGKGSFLRSCEEQFLHLDLKPEKRKHGLTSI